MELLGLPTELLRERLLKRVFDYQRVPDITFGKKVKTEPHNLSIPYPEPYTKRVNMRDTGKNQCGKMSKN